MKLPLGDPVQTVQVVEWRGGEERRGGGIRSAEFWWLFFCCVYPLGFAPALCAKGRREIRLKRSLFSLTCISPSISR